MPIEGSGPYKYTEIMGAILYLYFTRYNKLHIIFCIIQAWNLLLCIYTYGYKGIRVYGYFGI